MINVTILPMTTEQGAISYRAVAGAKHSSGNTPGAALDALTAQLSADDTSTLVIVQSLRPDSYFTATQQRRLGHLMKKWRQVRDQASSLSAKEQVELEKLVEAELDAATQRAAALADNLGL